MLADRVLFIDGEAIIIDKPAGLPVDEPRDGRLSVQNHLESLSFGFQRWPTPVHRLDQDTSGCLLLARNPKALKRFQRSFEARDVTKRYIAVLDGVVEGGGTIDLPLSKTSSAEAGWRMVPDEAGKSAVTNWRTLAVRDGKTLVEFTPETGRTHQLRVHAASALGCPIMGDPVYSISLPLEGEGRVGVSGAKRVNMAPPLPTPLPAGEREQRMMLHASFLSLVRAGKPPAEATAPLPPHFTEAGWALPGDRGADD